MSGQATGRHRATSAPDPDDPVPVNAKDLLNNAKGRLRHVLRDNCEILTSNDDIMEFLRYADELVRAERVRLSLPNDRWGFQLPDDVLKLILQYLDAPGLCTAMQVCTTWRNAAESDELWGALYNAHWQGERALATDDSLNPVLEALPTARERYAERLRVRRNWRAGRCHVLTLDGHQSSVYCTAVGEGFIVSGSRDKTIKVWTIKGACLATLAGHTDSVWALSLRGQIVASASSDESVRLWNLNESTCLHTLLGHVGSVYAVHMTDDLVFSGGEDRSIRVWNAKDGSFVRALNGHESAIRSLYVDASEPNRLVSGANDFLVNVWDVASGTLLQSLEQHVQRVRCVQILKDTLVTGSSDATVCFRGVPGFELRDVMKARSAVTCLSLSRTSMVYAQGSSIHSYRLHSRQREQEFEGHNGAIFSLHADAGRMVSGSADATIRVWDFTAREPHTGMRSRSRTRRRLFSFG